jgi:cytochrome P450
MGRRDTIDRVFTAHCVRTGTWWAIDVPELERDACTQARRLDQVEGRAREAIALMLELHPDDVGQVRRSVDLPAAIRTEVALVDALRERVARVEREAANGIREAVKALVNEQHLTVRDIGSLLGLSFQRVSQLLSSAAAAAEMPHTTTHVMSGGRKPVTSSESA